MVSRREQSGLADRTANPVAGQLQQRSCGSESRLPVYEGTEKGRNSYHFVCPCGADGTLTVPINDRKPFPCPEGCGRVYVQWRPADRAPVLTCVVYPVSVTG